MKVSVCTKRNILEECSLPHFEYQVDPYVGCEHNCHYCYVLPQAETDWAKEIMVHENYAERLAQQISELSPQTIYMGYHTDPYQPVEALHCQTRQTLELFLSKGFSASILTKSDLVLRDIDLLKEMKESFVSVSVAFNDDPTRILFEGNTMETEKRIEALRKLKEAGVGTGALVCPVIPYVTDPVPLFEPMVPFSDVIWIYPLNFRDRAGQNCLNVRQILDERYPSDAEKIMEILADKENQYWTDLRNELSALNENRNLKLSIHV